jgi:DNA end-binding protein Ku
MRAIWSGTISFGLVSIPVRLYSATEDHDVAFHLLHKKDGARLKNLRWCPVDEKAVSWDEVERGYEYAKGQYVAITDEDLQHLPLKTTHSVDVSDFVKLQEVDPIYYDKAYYLAPEENGAKAFNLFRDALEQTGRAAVAKVTLRNKESLCLVRPYRDILTLETMFYADEVRSTGELSVSDGKVSSKEMQMAVSLIDNLSDKFDIDRYHDEYQEAAMKLVRSKVEGAPLPKAPKAGGPKVVDLMEALRASIEQTKRRSGAAKSEGHSRTKTRTAAKSRTAAKKRKTA